MKKLNLDLDKIKSDYLSGLPTWKVALKHNTSKVTITKYLKRMGIIIIKPIKSKFRFLNKELLLNLHNAGCSPTEIAVKLETSTTAITNYLKRHNIIPNYCDLSEHMLKLEDLSRPWATKENLYELYIMQQKTLDEIAALYNVQSETIKVLLIRRGITPRTLSEANKLSANKPAGRMFRSKIARELWQDDEIRNRIVAKLKSSHPQMPPGHAEHVSESMKALYQDDVYYQKHAQQVKRLWLNPTKAMLDNLYELIQGMQDSKSEIKQKFNQAINSEEHLDNLSFRTLQQWQDQEFLEKKLPEIRLKISEAVKTAWKDPKYRESIVQHKTFTSKLEIIVHGVLDDLGIHYKKICPSGYQFDICIEPEELNRLRGVLIEINGLYWHKDNPNDSKKFEFWKDKLSDRYDFETIWEHEFGARQSLFNRLMKILKINKCKEVILDELILKEINAVEAEKLYNKYHYLANARRGKHYGTFYNNVLIGACTFSMITRLESAKRLNVSHQEIRELSRFCLNPIYRHPNLASYVLSRFVQMFKNDNRNIKKLLTFADPDIGHLGTIYKATNWVEDGLTGSSYYYVRDGFHYDKKTVYDYAKNYGMLENEFVQEFRFERIKSPPKYRFICDL